MLNNSCLKKDLSMIRMVVSDLDGTLLNSGKTISKNCINSIRLAQKSGILFTINTGREYAMLDGFLNEIRPNAPVISNNGAEITKWPENVSIQRIGVPDKESKKLLKYCFDNGFDFCATTVSAAFFPPNSQMTPFYEDYDSYAKKKDFVVSQLLPLILSKILNHWI